MVEEIILDRFKYYLKEKRKLSDSTTEFYCGDIRCFEKYIYKNSYNMLEINKTQILSYILDMKKGGKSDSSLLRSISSIRALYNFLIGEGFVRENPTVGIEMPKPEKKLPEILSGEEVDRLLDSASGDSHRCIRDKAMLEVMYASGIKVSELIALSVDDADTDLGYLRCIHTSGEVRIIPIGRTAVSSLKRYLCDSRPFMVSADTRELFVNCRGTAMSRQGFWKIIKEYSSLAGIKKDITPRTLRHSFAVHMLSNGADIISIQEMLGHKDIASTQIYSSIVHGKIREVYNKTHPRA